MNHRTLPGLLAVGFLGTGASAQWPSDPAVNLLVADDAGSQVQPKTAAASDGSTYVSWFDGGSGYDVRLQRLTDEGAEAWAHGGVLVADRSFSSTQDYGLALDHGGMGLLAFRDDRSGSTQISAARVAADGSIMFDTQLTTGGAFVAAPKIAGTSDDGIVVGWTENSTVRLQRLDPDGAPQWGTGVILTDGAGDLSLGGIADAGGGAVVVSLVRAASFSAPKHLVAHKIGADGATLWGSTGVDVFNTGSLQFGNFPGIDTDGGGGAILAWYGVSPLQTYVQHLDGNGSALLDAGGLALSTNGTRIRVSPTAAYDQATGDIYAFWVEQNSGQSMHGVYGQRVTAEADRAWGDDGLVVVPVGSIEHGQVRTAIRGGCGASVTFVDVPSPPFGDRVRAAAFDADGSPAWAGTLTEVSTTLANKSRLSIARHRDDELVLAWTDERTDSGDIYAQNLNTDGTLGTGSAPGDLDGDGVVGVSDLLLLLAAWGDCPTTCGCVADIDGDGTVGVEDLLIVLARWG